MAAPPVPHGHAPSASQAAPDFLAAIDGASSTVVEAGGFHWRVRKINSRMLVSTGKAALALVPGAAPEEETPEPAPDVMAQLKRLPDRALAAMLDQQGAVVAAGVVAVGNGTAWQDVRILTGEPPAERRPGTLHIDQLPAGVESALFAAIMAVSTDGGAAAHRLAAFRAESGDASAP